MTIRCECGHIISDRTDNLPYKGYILRDQHDEQVFVQTTENVIAFMQALANSEKYEWLSSHFSKEYADLELEDSSVVADLISEFHIYDYRLSIYQCEQCSRLLVQHPLNGGFRSFEPEDEDSSGILEVKKQTDNNS